jgi:hypothetical protein
VDLSLANCGRCIGWCFIYGRSRAQLFLLGCEDDSVRGVKDTVLPVTSLLKPSLKVWQFGLITLVGSYYHSTQNHKRQNHHPRQYLLTNPY